MVDYVESPLDSIVEVGWPTTAEGEVTEVSTGGGVNPTSTMRGVTTAFCSANALLGGPGVPTNTHIWLQFRHDSNDPGWKLGRTLSEVLNATWTQESTGLTFRASDHLSTVRCVSSSTAYGNGGTYVHAPGQTAYGRQGSIFISGTIYSIQYLSNNGLSGWDFANYGSWSADPLTITWP